eukprot:4676106-Pyramimonas_sp.AAC.1
MDGSEPVRQRCAEKRGRGATLAQPATETLISVDTADLPMPWCRPTAGGPLRPAVCDWRGDGGCS